MKNLKHSNPNGNSLGSYRVDHYCRVVPISIPCKGYGSVDCFQLVRIPSSSSVNRYPNISRLWNFLLAFFTPFITSAIDFRFGYVFAACNFLAGVIVFFFLIESQGRTLEEIDTMYLERVTPMKSSHWVPPSTAEMAAIRKAAGTDETAVLEDGVPDEERPRETMSGETERGLEDQGMKNEEKNEHRETI